MLKSVLYSVNPYLGRTVVLRTEHSKEYFSWGGGEASRFDITHKSAREDAKSVGSVGF